MARPPERAAGDVVRLKKIHACGANDWLVLRMGMDVCLQCRGCGRELRLKRHEFEKMVKNPPAQP